jgi:Na+/melibiose symporter-like transporter
MECDTELKHRDACIDRSSDSVIDSVSFSSSCTAAPRPIKPEKLPESTSSVSSSGSLGSKISLNSDETASGKPKLMTLFSLCSNLSMVDTAFAFYTLDFLMYTVKLPGGIVGYIILGCEIFTVFIGPISSFVMGKYYSKSMGQHRSWLSFSLPLLLLSFMGLWWNIPVPQNYQIVYFSFVLVIFNLSYGTMLLAYEGCIPSMFSDSADLLQLNSYRLFAGSISSVFALFLGALLSKASESYRFLLQNGIISILLAISYLSFIASTNEVTICSGQTELGICEKHTEEKELSWWETASQLLQSKSFNVMIISHFLLGMITISTHSTIHVYVRDYLKYDSSGGFLTHSYIAMIVMQLGPAIIQFFLGYYPLKISLIYLVRASILCTAIASICFATIFEYKLAPKWLIFPVCFVSGLGIGGLYTVYEIFVPEVIFQQQMEFERIMDNQIYGFVDSTRGISLALTFLIVGKVLENVELGLALRLCIGYLPLGVSLLCLALSFYHPKIILSDDRRASVCQMK